MMLMLVLFFSCAVFVISTVVCRVTHWHVGPREFHGEGNDGIPPIPRESSGMETNVAGISRGCKINAEVKRHLQWEKRISRQLF